MPRPRTPGYVAAASTSYEGPATPAAGAGRHTPARPHWIAGGQRTRAARSPEGAEHMAVFVLVHGAWGGAHGFRKVRGPLREAGHEVFTPSLTGIGERVHLTSPQVCL